MKTATVHQIRRVSTEKLYAVAHDTALELKVSADADRLARLERLYSHPERTTELVLA